jgi:tetratricopeptide (TPR) repeat protein
MKSVKISRLKKTLVYFWVSLPGIWLILNIAKYLGFDIFYGQKWNGLLLIILFGFVVTIIILWKKGHIHLEFNLDNPVRTKYKIIDDIQYYFEKGNYDTVVRLGNGLSRTLYLEGHYKLRYDIGILVEEAASKVGDNKTKCASLIDYIGWSLVLLKSIDNTKAKNYINHGIDVAKNEKQNYWVAKGTRHIAAIEIMDDNYDAAIIKLDEALLYSNKIEDIQEKNEMNGGIYYDYALAYYFLKKYEDASKFCKMSREIREIGGDKSRICRMFAIEGKIEEAKRNYPNAKDVYRKGLLYAEEVNRKDEIIRNRLGLARILKYEDIKKAKEHLKVAQSLSQDELDFDIYGKEEIPLL